VHVDDGRPERAQSGVGTWKLALTKALLTTAGVVVLSGCNSGGKREEAWRGQVAASLDRRHLPNLQRTSVEVSKILYERNLISEPEVNRKMNEAVLRITKDGASPDSVMPNFLNWLEDWIDAHPAQAEAARLVGGAYTIEARRMYVDTDSSRKAQTDSIRRLVRARAKRRTEASMDSVRRE
jgi:hypothetical protein